MLALVLAPILTFVGPAPPAPSCPLAQTTQTAQHGPPAVAHKLGDLPDADLDLAVLRSVDGCAVRQVVRFHVSDPSPGGAEAGMHMPGIKGTLVPQGIARQSAQPVR